MLSTRLHSLLITKHYAVTISNPCLAVGTWPAHHLGVLENPCSILDLHVVSSYFSLRSLNNPVNLNL